MIARLLVVLPFELVKPLGSTLSPQIHVRDGYEIRLFAPRFCPVGIPKVWESSASATRAQLDLLKSDAPEQALVGVRVNGEPASSASLLQIDFYKPAEFDRRPIPVERLADTALGDPTPELAFAVANDFLSRMRSVTGASGIRDVQPTDTLWRIDYLNDDGSELQESAELIRSRLLASYHQRLQAIDVPGWEALGLVPPGRLPLVWDTLLLDAEVALPHIGSSVVLANAALETFIEKVLVGQIARMEPFFRR